MFRGLALQVGMSFLISHFFTTVIKYWTFLLKKVTLDSLVKGNCKFWSLAMDLGSHDFIVQPFHCLDVEKVI